MSRIIGGRGSGFSDTWDLRTQQLLKKQNYWPASADAAVFGLVENSAVSVTNATTLNFNSVFGEGDLVFVIGFDDGQVIPSTPTGWTSLNSSDGSDSSSLGSRVVYKFMGASPDSSVTGLTSLGTDGGYFSFAFGNVTSIVTNGLERGSSSTIGFPSVSALAGDIVIAIALKDNANMTLDVPTGYTLISREGFGADLSSASYMAAFKTLTADATEDPPSISAGSNEGYHSYTIVLRG